MISAKLLNSDATLNDFTFVGEIAFFPGENVRISLQIQLTEKKIRYIPPVAATLTLTFLDKEGEEIVKTAAVINADDRSMWVVVLSQAESEVLQGQNIVGTLDVNGDASVVYKFLMANVIQRTNLAGDC